MSKTDIDKLYRKIFPEDIAGPYHLGIKIGFYFAFELMKKQRKDGQ